MLTIWGRKTSSNVQALMWCIGELSLPYQRHDVGHRFGGLDTDAFATLNPNQTIPVLQDGEAAPIWETGAILRYLAARYGKDDFWPTDPLRRAEIDKWAEWAKLNIAAKFTVPIFWHVVRTAPHQRNAGAIEDAVTALEDMLAIAETQLCDQPYLAGRSFTLGDIQLGHILFRYYDIDICRRDLPALQDYFGRLRQRPAFREHVEISYGELRVL